MAWKMSQLRPFGVQTRQNLDSTLAAVNVMGRSLERGKMVYRYDMRINRPIGRRRISDE